MAYRLCCDGPEHELSSLAGRSSDSRCLGAQSAGPGACPQGTTRGILVNVLGSVTAVVAMSSQPDLWLAVEPAHLPHYSHTAVVVGSVIILSIIVLMVGITFVWSKRR